MTIYTIQLKITCYTYRTDVYVCYIAACLYVHVTRCHISLNALVGSTTLIEQPANLNYQLYLWNKNRIATEQRNRHYYVHRYLLLGCANK